MMQIQEELTPVGQEETHSAVPVPVSEDSVKDVAVVVPTCGRPALLDRCLSSLVRQNFARERYEIIVVDDRPDPETEWVVRQWGRCAAAQGGPRVTYIASPGPHGPAAARNRGWQAAHA